MRLERLWRGIVACQFAFGQRGVDFVVANLVQQNRWPALAAPQLRHEVVQALLGVRRNGAVAQGADRVAHSLATWRSAHG